MQRKRSLCAGQRAEEQKRSQTQAVSLPESA